MPCNCGTISHYDIGGPIRDCYYCEALKQWGASPGVTRDLILEEFMVRVSDLSIALKRLEDLGEDVSSARPLRIDHERAAKIIEMYNTYIGNTSSVPSRLHRSHAGYGQIHSLLQTVRNSTADIKSFQNAFSLEIATPRRWHALMAYAAHAPK